MAVTAIIGSTGASQQGTLKSWTYVTGEGVTVSYRGPGPAIEALYQLYKTVAGYNPTYDTVETEYSRGVGQMVVRTVEDGATLYELYANELQKPIWDHTYFSTLTYKQIHDARVQFAQGTEVTTPAKAVELYNLMCKGTEY